MNEKRWVLTYNYLMNDYYMKIYRNFDDAQRDMNEHYQNVLKNKNYKAEEWVTSDSAHLYCKPDEEYFWTIDEAIVKE